MNRDLRDDPTYWDALAKRVAATAAWRSKQSGFSWLADSRAGVVTAMLLVAAVAAFTTLSTGGSSLTSFREEWSGALAPSDAVGEAIVQRDQPPAIGALLVAGPTGSVR